MFCCRIRPRESGFFDGLRSDIVINMNNRDVTQYKFVAILNKKVAIGKAMNVLGHMTASLAAHANPEQLELMGMVDYADKDGNSHKASKDSFVVLRADNGNQIRTVRNAAKEMNLLFVDFANTMQEGTYLEQLERTSQTLEQDLDYYGILVFGKIDEVGSITKKFSLWQ